MYVVTDMQLQMLFEIIASVLLLKYNDIRCLLNLFWI